MTREEQAQYISEKLMENPEFRKAFASAVTDAVNEVVKITKVLQQELCNELDFVQPHKMNEQMEFPETFERFAREYGFKDDKEVYTNGLDLIPIFRVNQWLEYDNKLRAIEADTAYECGKHANKWIPVSEEYPQKSGVYWVTTENGIRRLGYFEMTSCMFVIADVIAWMPFIVPEPYKASPTGAERSTE